MNADPTTNSILVLCQGDTFKTWPLYAVDIQTAQVKFVSGFESGSVLKSFALLSYKSEYAFSLGWGTGESFLTLNTYQTQTGNVCIVCVILKE
jgi:hypothetical protein